jgi:hypothetical protein
VSEPVEVADWTREAKAFSPSLTAELGTSVADALAAVADGLAGQRFRISGRSVTGFTATHRDLVGGVLGVLTASDLDILDRTRLEVTAVPTDHGCRLTVSVRGGGERRAGRTRGPAGLTAAFQGLQRRGVALRVSPWVRA